MGVPFFSNESSLSLNPIRREAGTPSLLTFFLVLLAAVSGGCSQGDERPRKADRDFDVLVEVDGVERTVYDFESSYVEHLIRSGRNDTKEERRAHLDKMIDDILLAQSAADKGLTDHPIYLSAVQHEQRKSMIDTYFIDEMEREVEPLTDDEIRLAYAKRLRSVYVRQLYSANPADLDSAYAELESGASFVDVANRFYQTPSYDSLAGYLGPISYFGVDDAVAEAAYSTPQGAYTPPVRSRLGYHILYVEHVEFPALLAEDDYQYRKQGVESQLRLRRQRLVSSEYVYEVMSSLDVRTNRENLLRLRDAIESLDGEGLYRESPAPESGETVWTDQRVKRLAGSLDRDLELAAYTLDGEPQVFTFGEYVSWLPYLSFQESKVRLGASVGRGMRNQVLLERASALGYEGDERVRKSIRKRATDVLSELNQYELTMAALRDTGQVQVPDSFRERMIASRELLMRAGYWKVPAANFQAAEGIKNRLTQGADPAEFDGYSQTAFAPLAASEPDYDLVRKTPLGSPVVGYSQDDGWLVLQVEARELEEVAASTRMQDLERSFNVYDTIRSEIDSLRSRADIRIDEELFDEIYKVWTPGG